MTTCHVVRVPSDVQLTRVEREWMTQGWIYCVWEVDMQTPCWISQSLPAIIAAINPGLSKTKQLHVSSLYRLLRGESRSMIHKNQLVTVFKRKDAGDINEYMRKLPSCKFVTKDVTSWKAMRDDGEKNPPGPKAERAPVAPGRTPTDPSGLWPLLQTS